MEPVRMPLRVRYHECDPQGVVFNANYLAYFDMASFEFLTAVLGKSTGLNDFGVDFVVAESNVRFLRALRFEDEVVVSVRIGHLGNTSLVLEFELWRGEETVATGTNRYVFVNAETLTKQAPPEEIRAKLLEYQALGASPDPA
ncbi:acyl-CoA thioesterase [Amycolatopsis albispora]|uniref:4-hydroxybenzoyl-CoA thioesterase n=1 Tax=Amycolatopsis albispora TaxID=1804986 RepID=A0A344LEX2_9PSEU|nr:thioesterase family protein [Amycolatopsis albispora]AXB46596.1 4-hydroxybenzoyl-CoA thioesterase [Amycolatopsis albispora]